MWHTRDDNNNTFKGKVLLIIPEDKSLVELHSDFFKRPESNTTAIELLTLRK